MARIVNRSLNSDWTVLLWDIYQDTSKTDDYAILEATSAATFEQIGRWYTQIKKGDASSVVVEVTLDPYELAKNDTGDNPDICTWTRVGDDTVTDRMEFFSPVIAIRVKFIGSGTEPAKVSVAVS